MSSTSGFNFQAAQQYLQRENARATAARKDNATYNEPNFPELHDRRCMAIALGSEMYNIDFMDGEGDMVVSIDELILDNPPERVDVDTEPRANVTQEEKEARAESEIPSRIRILICGDREWEDVTAIKEVLEELPRSTIIIHGDDIGVDSIVDRCAILCGMEVKSYPAINGEKTVLGADSAPYFLTLIVSNERFSRANISPSNEKARLLMLKMRTPPGLTIRTSASIPANVSATSK